MMFVGRVDRDERKHVKDGRNEERRDGGRRYR